MAALCHTHLVFRPELGLYEGPVRGEREQVAGLSHINPHPTPNPASPVCPDPGPMGTV